MDFKYRVMPRMVNYALVRGEIAQLNADIKSTLIAYWEILENLTPVCYNYRVSDYFQTSFKITMPNQRSCLHLYSSTDEKLPVFTEKRRVMIPIIIIIIIISPFFFIKIQIDWWSKLEHNITRVMSRVEKSSFVKQFGGRGTCSCRERLYTNDHDLQPELWQYEIGLIIFLFISFIKNFFHSPVPRIQV